MPFPFLQIGNTLPSSRPPNYTNPDTGAYEGHKYYPKTPNPGPFLPNPEPTPEEIINPEPIIPLQFADFLNMDGFIQSTGTVPTETPANIYGQIKLYTSGATKKLYIYDIKEAAWRYVALT